MICSCLLHKPRCSCNRLSSREFLQGTLAAPLSLWLSTNGLPNIAASAFTLRSNLSLHHSLWPHEDLHLLSPWVVTSCTRPLLPSIPSHFFQRCLTFCLRAHRFKPYLRFPLASRKYKSSKAFSSATLFIQQLQHPGFGEMISTHPTAILPVIGLPFHRALQPLHLFWSTVRTSRELASPALLACFGPLCPWRWISASLIRPWLPWKTVLES